MEPAWKIGVPCAGFVASCPLGALVRSAPLRSTYGWDPARHSRLLRGGGGAYGSNCKAEYRECTIKKESSRIHIMLCFREVALELFCGAGVLQSGPLLVAGGVPDFVGNAWIS